MKKERLYELAHEALLHKWSTEYTFLQDNPENKILQSREKELWNELIELEEKMRIKGYKLISNKSESRGK